MFVSNGSLVLKTPVSLTSSWFPSMPPMSAHGWPTAYAGIYTRQLWVYVVVSKLAKATARLPLPVYERNELDRSRRDDHPLAKLLRNPNPGLSGYDLMLWTSSTKDIYGDTFWLKQRRNGAVVGLYPLHPTSMTYVPERGAWRFDNGSKVIEAIPESDLVRFRSFHPDSLIRGLSPLEPLRSTLENEWHARNATSSFWARGARPGTALVHPGNISEPAATRVKAQYDSIAGGSGNTGATVVLEEGMLPHKLELTAEEAQYIETRKLNREEVCAAYDVPPPAVHILDRATFSNITEQLRSMYRDTMGSRLPGFEAAIELDLRQAEWPDDDVYAEFLMDEVLRGDFETRQDALNKASHMTIAEKRKVENLPFIEGTDRIFLNTATMPLDAIDAQSAALVAQTGEPPATPDDQALADVIPLSVARSVMGRLSWQQSLEQVDARSLTEGLPSGAAERVSDALDAEVRDGGTVASLRGRLRGLAGTQTKAVRAKVPELTAHEGQIRRVLVDFFDKQGTSVLVSGRFDARKWTPELASELHATAVAVASSVGKSAVRGLGFDPSVYNVAQTVNFLKAVALRLAESINETTAAQFATSDSPADVFEVAKTSRAAGIASGTTTLLAGFAMTEAGKQLANSQGVTPTKTWATGSNPRAEHAAMDGETVGIEDTFSNGNQWPGGEPGCNCTVEVGF